MQTMSGIHVDNSISALRNTKSELPTSNEDKAHSLRKNVAKITCSLTVVHESTLY